MQSRVRNERDLREIEAEGIGECETLATKG